jgi:acetolactate synthase-1/2/3 large subunit
VIVADLVADVLARAGVGRLFTVMATGPGAAVVNAAGRHDVGVVATPSGGAACLMAAVTGSLLDAPGGAALNDAEDVREALGQAMRDRSPLMLISDSPLTGDIKGIVKASVVVEAATAAHWSAHAAQLAMTDPRGPVQLVVAPGVATEPAIPVATSVRPAPSAAPAVATLDLAADILARAARPLLVVGLECRSVEVATWIRALAESLPAPVLVTRKGKGAVPDPHPLHLGLIERAAGRHPILARADLAMTIGVDPAEIPPDAWPSSLSILHLGALPWASRMGKAEVDVVGDISLVIAELAPRLRGRQRADWDVAEIDRLKRAPATVSARLPGPRGLAGHIVVGVVREAMPPGTVAVIAAEEDALGLIAAWKAVAPGELIAPTSPAVPGFALAAAVAAGTARPEARVVCVATPRQVLDGRAALATAARLALSVLLVVIGETGISEGESVVRAALAAGWTTTAVASVNGLRRAIEDSMVARGPMLIDTCAQNDERGRLNSSTRETV